MQTHRAKALNWVSADRATLESFWVLAQRFMIRNVISPYEFCLHFERPALRGKSVARHHIYDRLDLNRLAPFLGHSGESLRTCLPAPWEIGAHDRGLRPLKLCAGCAEQGYHSTLFETGWLDICPIHNRPLTNRCPTCNKLLSHISWKRFGPAPGALACGHAWSDVSVRNTPKLDASSVRRLADWVRRLKGRGTEETWYAVSLHGANCLRQEDRDFIELVDCLAAIVGIGKAAGMRNAFWLRHFRPARLQHTTMTALREDWFDATLHRVSRYIGALVELPWQEQLAYLRRPYETHRWLRALGERRFIDAIRQRLCLLPLRGLGTRRIPLDKPSLNTIACALLHKHALSSSYPQDQVVSATDQLERMCRFTGAPLGCLRVSRRDITVFWTPNVLAPNRLNPRPAS